MSKDAIELKRKLDAALLAGEVGTFEWDILGDRLWGDRNFRQMFGLSTDAGEAAPLEEYIQAIHPDDRAAVRDAIARTLETGCAYKAEYRIVHKEKTRWVIARGVGERDEGGRVVRFPGVIVDITERKRAEEARRGLETKYRRLYQTMMDAFVCVDMEGRIQECNHVYRTLLGYEWDELKTLRYTDLTPETWHEYEAEIVRTEILPRGYSSSYEKEYRRKDGTCFPVELRTFLIRDDRGAPSGMWAIVRDITDRKAAETALAAYQQTLETVVNSMPAAVCLIRGNDLRLQLVNPAYQALAPSRMMVGKTLEELWPETGKQFSMVCRQGLRRVIQ